MSYLLESSSSNDLMTHSDDVFNALQYACMKWDAETRQVFVRGVHTEKSSWYFQYYWTVLVLLAEYCKLSVLLVNLERPEGWKAVGEKRYKIS